MNTAPNRETILDQLFRATFDARGDYKRCIETLGHSSETTHYEEGRFSTLLGLISNLDLDSEFKKWRKDHDLKDAWCA